MDVLCECNGMDCKSLISIPESVFDEIKLDQSQVVIADDCPTGAEPTDVFVRNGEGYKIYRMA